jgi:extradiol dioxygenase family protein
MDIKRFHISLPCKDIAATKKFYNKELGFEIGRKTYNWFDVNLFGNQITFTADDSSSLSIKKYSFDDVLLPSFHFGVILDENTWDNFYMKFKDKDYFAIGCTKFLSNKKGEHSSFFINDVNGYFIEFKKFSSEEEVFDDNEYVN